jgi:hypothetical protein
VDIEGDKDAAFLHENWVTMIITRLIRDAQDTLNGVPSQPDKKSPLLIT